MYDGQGAGVGGGVGERVSGERILTYLAPIIPQLDSITCQCGHLRPFSPPSPFPFPWIGTCLCTHACMHAYRCLCLGALRCVVLTITDCY